MAKVTARQRALARRVARLTERLAAFRKQHTRQVAALQRGADQRLAEVLRELTALRHHEARAEALTRVLAERDTALAQRDRRIAELEEVLRSPTHLG